MMRPAVAAFLLLAAGLHQTPALAQAPSAPPPVEAPDAAPPPLDSAADAPLETGPSGRRWNGPVMRIGSNYSLAAGEEIREVFVMGGNVTIEGHVRQDVVIVFGTLSVGDTAVIGGSLVVVGGQVVIEPGARVEEDFVVVGGDVQAPPEFNPDGQHIVIAPDMIGGRLDAVVPWVTRGLLLGRPIVPDLPWVWPIVGLFLAVSVALTLLFERPVRACSTTLTRRPLTSLLVGLVVLLLLGPVLLLLTVSIVGVVVVPFLLCALVLAWILGRVGVARWIGLSMIPETDDGVPADSRARAVRSSVIGFAVLIVAYMIPVLGIITWATVGVLGLGSAVLALLAGYRSENPAAPRPSPATRPGPTRPATETGPAVPLAGTHATAFQAVDPADPAMSGHSGPGFPPPSPLHPPGSPFAQTMATDLLERPHAPFRDRLAAFVIDVIVVVLSVQLLDIDDGPRVVILLLLAYHILFWTLKATTIGGIICQLRLVRVSGEPIRFVDSFVRAFSAIFSLGAAGLGGLWIIKDPDRQAWHDKIAGTYVVKVPRHYPL